MFQFTRCTAGFVIVVAFALHPAPMAIAQGQTLPVPRAAIYPGDVITAVLLEERRVQFRDPAGASAFASWTQLLGKVARRTLLPGQAVPVSAIREPDLVRSGKIINLVFASGDLTISGRGTALQSGGKGDIISIQNSDSSAVVRGTVQADGTVLIEE